jgi:recombination protein RecA
MGEQRRNEPCIPTGFPQLDAAFGTDGWPRGSFVEIFGAPSTGKTAFALQTTAAVQAAGGSAAWIDADGAYDARFAATLGVCVGALPVAQPGSAEEAFEVARRLISSGALDLLVVDSLAALVPEAEFQAGIGDLAAGLQSRVLSTELRKLSAVVFRARAAVIFLNQVRLRRSASSALDVETSAGGASLKLYASLRIALRASGRRVRFQVVKNRAGRACGHVDLMWIPGEGFTKGL